MPSTPTEVPSLSFRVRDRSSRPEAGAAPLSLFGLEFSLDTASLDALDVVARAVTRARVGEWFACLEGTEEVALLSTCHRVDLVLLVRAPEVVDRWREVLPGNPGSWKLHPGREMVHHLFRVAAGHESLAVGEAEVRQQVRAAGGTVESRHPRPVLRELFSGAAAAADEVHPSVPPSWSVASIAAERLLELVGRPHPRVLVIGFGAVGRRVVETLSSRAQVTVLFHQRPPEEAFLRSMGARAAPLERLAEELAACDAVITATKFGDGGLRVSDVPRERPLVLVDLGVPRNVDPRVRDLPQARLVDLEDLRRLTDRPFRADGSDARLEELADRFSERLERLLVEPWIDAFRRAAEEVRRSELAHARPFLGPLDPSQEAALERLTQRLVTRLLLTPTERIRSLPPGPEGDLQRRLAVALLDPRPTEP